MAQTAHPAGFRFGVELELAVKSKTRKHDSFESLASEVSSHLTAAKVPNHVTGPLAKHLEKYQEWSIMKETSITPPWQDSMCQ